MALPNMVTFRTSEQLLTFKKHETQNTVTVFYKRGDSCRPQITEDNISHSSETYKLFFMAFLGFAYILF
jgi:hypothetical protein